MIRVTSLKNAGDISQYDIAWAIVRSWKGGKGFQQVSALSPPKYTFFEAHKKIKADKWDKGSFEGQYMNDMFRQLSSPAAQAKLKYLYEQDKLGKKILLCCYCPEEQFCHRIIVASLLAAAGADVHTDSGSVYKEYALRYIKERRL